MSSDRFKSPPKLFYDGTLAKNALKAISVQAVDESTRQANRGEEPDERLGDLKHSADRAAEILEEVDLFEGEGLGADSTFGSLIVYASRYAMGRKSYAVGEVTDWLKQHWDLLAPSVKEQIQTDIERRLKDESHAQVIHDNPERKPSQPLGQDFDREQWLEILDLPIDD